MQIAIVTGASSGIGQSAAIQIAKRGIGVVLTYNGNKRGAGETVQGIERQGGSAVALPLNVGRIDTFPEFKAQVVDALSTKWDVSSFRYLVNNAGVGRMAMFEDMTEDLFDELSNVLFKGPYFLTQSLLPLMEDEGAIVNIGSNSSLPNVTSPGYSAYASMKGAVSVLTRYLAKEFAGRRIRVNCVAPGPTRTRFADDAFERFPEVIPPLVAQTALGRLSGPDDVGKVIAFLLSEESAWITAQTIEVSGGFNL